MVKITNILHLAEFDYVEHEILHRLSWEYAPVEKRKDKNEEEFSIPVRDIITYTIDFREGHQEEALRELAIYIIGQGVRDFMGIRQKLPFTRIAEYIDYEIPCELIPDNL